MKPGPLKDLQDDFLKRLRGAATLREVEERRKLPDPRRREAELLLGAVPPGLPLVVLDERGVSLTSADFARRLGGWGTAAFLVGGTDGLDDSIREKADFLLALGPMTWPHFFARVLLLEQIYRAQTILSGHPYHRA